MNIKHKESKEVYKIVDQFTITHYPLKDYDDDDNPIPYDERYYVITNYQGKFTNISQETLEDEFIYTTEKFMLISKLIINCKFCGKELKEGEGDYVEIGKCKRCE